MYVRPSFQLNPPFHSWYCLCPDCRHPSVGIETTSRQSALGCYNCYPQLSMDMIRSLASASIVFFHVLYGVSCVPPTDVQRCCMKSQDQIPSMRKSYEETIR